MLKKSLKADTKRVTFIYGLTAWDVWRSDGEQRWEGTIVVEQEQINKTASVIIHSHNLYLTITKILSKSIQIAGIS